MKIFVGGLMPTRQQRIRELYPGVDFAFASDQEGRRRWLTRARSADLVIIDQGRCDHTITKLLKSKGVQYQLADGSAAIQQLIDAAIDAALEPEP
jgi:hypothetical protein